jgi:KDO2-lipid IV(A) lauroyltransferase
VGSRFLAASAYTMTLAARLVQQTGATVLLAWGERLPMGRGFCIHFRELEQALSS